MIDPSVFLVRGAVVLGGVRLGRDVSKSYNSVVRGDAERVEIGDEANIQDLSMVRAESGVPNDRNDIAHPSTAVIRPRPHRILPLWIDGVYRREQRAWAS